MPGLKVTQINVIKRSEMPQREVNTEFSKFVSEVAEAFKQRATKGDQAIEFHPGNAKKYTRYQLQKRLQRMGLKVVVRVAKDGKFSVGRVGE